VRCGNGPHPLAACPQGRRPGCRVTRAAVTGIRVDQRQEDPVDKLVVDRIAGLQCSVQVGAGLLGGGGTRPVTAPGQLDRGRGDPPPAGGTWCGVRRGGPAGPVELVRMRMPGASRSSGVPRRCSTHVRTSATYPSRNSHRTRCAWRWRHRASRRWPTTSSPRRKRRPTSPQSAGATRPIPGRVGVEGETVEIVSCGDATGHLLTVEQLS
jgi:hypothetical protein